MNFEVHPASRTPRPGGMRLVLVSSGVVFIVLLTAWALKAIVTVFEQGRTFGAVLLAIVTLVLLSAGIGVLLINWRAVHAPAVRPTMVPDSGDQTGIWGVGGPSMREPGSTGVWPARNVNRRYEDRDD
jgi:hypothetical protein